MKIEILEFCYKIVNNCIIGKIMIKKHSNFYYNRCKKLRFIQNEDSNYR